MNKNTDNETWYKQIPADEVNHTDREDAVLNIEPIPTHDLLVPKGSEEYTIRTQAPPRRRVGFSQIILQIDDNTAYDVTNGFTPARKKRECLWSISGTQAAKLRELTQDAVRDGKEPVLLLVCEHIFLWHYPMFFIGWYVFGKATGL
jgi:hypothetical protein